MILGHWAGIRYQLFQKETSIAVVAARAALAGRRQGRAGKRLVHDLPDGPRAPAALGAAAEAAVDLAGRARRLGHDRRAHVMVAQHVTGTNDHRRRPGSLWSQLQLSLLYGCRT